MQENYRWSQHDKIQKINAYILNMWKFEAEN